MRRAINSICNTRNSGGVVLLTNLLYLRQIYVSMYHLYRMSVSRDKKNVMTFADINLIGNCSIYKLERPLYYFPVLWFYFKNS